MRSGSCKASPSASFGMVLRLTGNAWNQEVLTMKCWILGHCWSRSEIHWEAQSSCDKDPMSFENSIFIHILMWDSPNAIYFPQYDHRWDHPQMGGLWPIGSRKFCEAWNRDWPWWAANPSDGADLLDLLDDVPIGKSTVGIMLVLPNHPNLDHFSLGNLWWLGDSPYSECLRCFLGPVLSESHKIGMFFRIERG